MSTHAGNFLYLTTKFVVRLLGHLSRLLFAFKLVLLNPCATFLCVPGRAFVERR